MTEGRIRTTVICYRRIDRFYIVSNPIKAIKPRRQYYTDDWRWQMGILQEKTATCCKNLLYELL